MIRKIRGWVADVLTPRVVVRVSGEVIRIPPLMRLDEVEGRIRSGEWAITRCQDFLLGLRVPIPAYSLSRGDGRSRRP